MWQVAAGMVGGACAALSLPAAAVATFALCVLTLGLVSRWPGLVATAAGIVYCGWNMQARLDDRLAPALENRPLAITGTVVSVPQGTLRSLRFRLAPRQQDAAQRLPRLLELTWYDAQSRVVAGEELQLEVKLRR